MPRPRPQTTLLLALVVLLLLTACGGAALNQTSGPQTGGPGSAPGAPVQATPAAASKPTTGAPQPTAAPAANAARSAADANQAPGGAAGTASEAKPAPERQANEQAPVAGLPSLDQRIIRTGKIDLTVADVGEALRSITRLVVGVGGYVQQSATKDQAGATIADLVLRVPVERYDNLFQDLRDLSIPDKRPIESSESQDVTEEFADVQARITNLKATEAQLLKLLERAEKMEEILVVQRELTGVREQIERLQGRLNVLERRSSFSTIAVTLRPQPGARKPAPPTLDGPRGANVTVRPTFSWRPSEGATTYELQVAKEIDTLFAEPVVRLSSLAVTSVELPAEQSDLQSETRYRWRVRGVNAAGEGDWSAPAVFTTVAAWNPLRTVAEAWSSSIAFLQRGIDAGLRLAVFFWWLLPLGALTLLAARQLNRVAGRRQPPPPAAPTAVAPPPTPGD